MNQMCHGTAIGCQPQIKGAAGNVWNPPMLTKKQVLLALTVNNLTNVIHHLVQANQLNTAAWTTNATAAFTTNVLNSSYRLTATNNSALQLYRIRTP